MNPGPIPTLQHAFQLPLQRMATTLRPRTLEGYAITVHRFLAFLGQAYPEVCHPTQLRRDPHILAFLGFLHQQHPPLQNATRIFYLIRLRRLLQDLAANDPSLTPHHLILPQDFPRPDVYLPKPLSAEDDQRLAQQLAGDDHLLAYALRLMRATGLRISECRSLPVDCLHPIAPDHCVLKVPLGKLHTERWLPLDDPTRQLITRILALRCSSHNSPFLLLSPSGRRPSPKAIRKRLLAAADRAGCASRITPHRLRHSFATEMISSGVSLPAVMRLLGHNDIRMTLRYVHVSQNDMQREYHRARLSLASRHPMPRLPVHRPFYQPPQDGFSAVQNALAAAQQLLACYRLKLSSDSHRRSLARLANRIVKISAELAKL